MQTSLGPPLTLGPSLTLPVSSAQRRSLGSTTTLCTEYRQASGWALLIRLIAAFGYGDGLPVLDLADGEGHLVAPVRKVDKDAARVGDGDAGEHGAVKRRHLLHALRVGGQGRKA